MEELYQNFGSSDSIRAIAVALSNLQMKTGNKITIYIDFIKYLFQLG